MQLGQFELHILQDGFFRVIHEQLLTGAQKAPVSVSSKNSTLLGVNLLLIKTPKHNILIDSGIGNKISNKYYKRYQISLPRQLFAELAKVGVKADDIDFVINTHLHFDHAGGNTILTQSKELKPVFTNAQYIVQKKEYEYALRVSEKENSSYFTENYLSLQKNNNLKLIDGNIQLLKGITLQLVGGHTPGLQIIKISSEDKGAIFPSDLIPTPWHINNCNKLDIDFDSKQLELAKNSILEEIEKDELLMFFQHSPRFLAAYLNKTADKKYALKKVKID